MPKKSSEQAFEAIAIGTSHGGFEALQTVLKPLPRDLSVPILVVRHQSPKTDDYVISALNKVCALEVTFATDGITPTPGFVYMAPPDRHMIIDESGRIKLTDGPKINHSRPAIDPLFESASEYWGSRVLAIVLTGANDDGTKGAIAVKKRGGMVMVQDPGTADAPAMPDSVLKAVEVDQVVWLTQIGPQIWSLCRKKKSYT